MMALCCLNGLDVSCLYLVFSLGFFISLNKLCHSDFLCRVDSVFSLL